VDRKGRNSSSHQRYYAFWHRPLAALRSFLVKIILKIISIPGHWEYFFRTVSSSKPTIPGNRSKEGDAGTKLADTHANEADRPSLIVEVGYSESLRSLQYDSHSWLEHTKGQTKMVIII